MFNSIKKKIVFALCLCICCVLSISGITLFFNKNNKTLIANSNGFTLSVGGDDKTKYVDGDTIMLKASKDDSASDQKLTVTFIPEYKGTIIDMRESLTINGQSMDTGLSMGSSATTGKDYSFSQTIFYSKEINKLNNAEVSSETLTGDNLQGRYTYTFEYTGDVQYVNTITFYVIFDVSYYSPQKGDTATVKTEPELLNTTKLSRYKYKENGVYETSKLKQEDKNKEDAGFTFSNQVESNFYHFDNNDYPTYSYDATKYNLSWEYSYNGLVDTFTTQYDGQGKVKVSKNGTEVETYECTLVEIVENDNKYTLNIVNLKFDQVGEYSFNILPVVLTENGYETLSESSCVKLKDEDHQIAYFGDVTLNIFGYQLFYTNYDKTSQNSVKEFKDSSIKTNLQNFTGFIDTNSKLTTDAINTLNKVTTNQAPVTFAKYNVNMSQSGGSSNSYAYYFPTADSVASKIEITSNTKFSNNGYYLVYTKYTYVKNLQLNKTDGSVVSDTSDCEQYFGFRINNGEPSVKMSTKDSLDSTKSNPFYANQITNKDITISWTENSNFDNPSIYEVYYSYDSSKEYIKANTNDTTLYSFKTENNTNNLTIKAQSNKIVYWKFIMKYGPTNNTSLTYNFTTDTTPITSEVWSVNKDKTTYTKGLNLASINTDFISTNSYFYVDYTSTKDSGAQVNSSYYYIPLEKDSDFNEISKTFNSTNTNNFEYIYNGYKLGTDSSLYSYAPTNVVDNVISGTSANNILSNAGLYLFKFEDSAGNINYKFVFVENTSSLVLVNPNPNNLATDVYSILNNDNSIYLQNINIIFGENKAINMNNISQIINDLGNDGNKFLSNYSSNLSADIIKVMSLQNKNDDYYIYFANKSAITPTNSNGDIITGNTDSIINQSNNKIIGYTIKLEKAEDEATYKLNINSNNQSIEKSILMSTDNSQVIAYHTNNTSYDFNKNSLAELNSTSDNNLYFTWINNKGDYEIESLTANFYPLTYDIDSSLYPYKETPSSQTNLLDNATKNGNSYSLDTPFETTGMYVITRKYKNALSNSSIDMQTRTYVYFIDRNKIFDSIKLSDTKTFTIGETISLLIGSNAYNDNEYQITLKSSDFSQIGSGSTLFDTNKLPVSIQATNFETLNKYSQISNITNASQKGLAIKNIHSNNFNYTENSWLNKIESAFKLDISINDQMISANQNITDYNNYNILISEANVKSNNKINHTLKFNISPLDPNGEFVEITGADYSSSSESYNKYSILKEHPTLNYINNTFFAWSDPTDEYRAKIDENEIKLYINGVSVQPTILQSNLQGFNHIINLQQEIEDFRNNNNISNNTDLFVVIHLQYLGYNNTYENYSRDEYIYFDFTAPDLNYKNLINNDKYLTQEQKNNDTFSNYNSQISFDNYAFSIDKSFNFTLDDETISNNIINNTEIKTNTTDIYFRKYNKYEDINSGEDIENLQSLISSDDRYSQNDRYLRLRFATYLDSVYKKIEISSTNPEMNFYNYLISNNISPFGYFEIIEIDMAGNERIYTIYLPKEEENIIFDIEENEESSIQPISTEPNYVYEVNSYLFNLKDIVLSNKEWLTLNVTRDNTLIESYKISPITISSYISIDKAIEIINNFAKNVDTDKGTAYKFDLTKQLISNNNVTNNSTYSIYFNYPSKEIEISLTEGISGGNKVLYISWTESLSTTIESFEIYYQDKNSEFQLLDNIEISTNEINPLSKFIILDITNGGSFKFVYKDNFNRKHTEFYMTGIENAASIEYSNNYISDEDITYTAGQVYVKYQPLTYKISITPLDENYKPLLNNDNTEIVIPIDQFNPYSSNTLTYIPLFKLNEANIQGYKITISNSLAQEDESLKVYNIVYMPLLGKLSIKDNTSKEIFNDSSIGVNVTSESCYVYIDDSAIPSVIPTYISGIFIKENGDVVDLGIIDPGSCLSNVNVGKYELTIYNSLGSNKKVTFEIRSSISKDYSIITTNTKQLLIASSVKYTYGTNQIDWFFTTDNYTINLSSIRYTKYTSVNTTELDGDITTIYLLNNSNDQLSSSYKEKYIAVTKMRNNYNFVNSNGNSLMIDNVVVTGTQYQSSNQNFVLSLSYPYYKFEGNLISIYYSYNDSDLTLLDSNSISFSNAGIYKFYFVDHAGNKQIFNNLDYFKVLLFNEVIINVNNSQKIDNAIFNEMVIISIVEPTIYKSNSFTISVLKNNSESLSVSKINNTYSFKDYGAYKVTITAELVQNSRQVQTVYNFVILNPNESYVAYEYIAPSGYEVTKIEKDGQDVTEQIRKDISKQLFENENDILNTISSLNLSGLENGIGGNGRYSITVLAKNINNNISKSFTFNVWINAGEEVYILSSISAGSSSTNPIRLKINTNLIYSEIGTCNIMINNSLWLSIDAQGVVTNHLSDSSSIVLVEASSENVAFSTYKIVNTGTYNIKIRSTNGNTLMSFTVTKAEPLNSTAILVIVISVVAIITFVVVFILLRKKMRVK